MGTEEVDEVEVEELKHREDTKAFQKTFKKIVVLTFKRHGGNPLNNN